ncbi:hypothetical protein JOY44_00675 [Phormidium sp. CLA17]|uniref:hypothetical protein n=1 Tax=Leptolyngbya sp. Cla-17 TaxID=2803751 RepID=UPI0014910A04|nr:hypothetical protein [Leptolyngbya sp. Cla-17]MBM0740170.1 hypothetical protein [Leptolyngbya sp. Cla-17]
MSQEPIPEPTDSDVQALPAGGTSFSQSRDTTESTTSNKQDLLLSEDVWESVEIENETQSTSIEEASVEKAAESLSRRRSSRVAAGTAVAINQATSWQKFQRYWQAEIQPALKEQTIKTLKATIRSLESLVARLEAKPTASSSQKGTAPWRQIRGIWGSVLGLTRSLLPRSFNRQLSDPLLSGAIAGVLLLTLWTTSSLIFSKSPTQVATAPANPSAPDKATDDDKEKSVLKSDQPVAKSTPDAIPETPPDDAIATQPSPQQTPLTLPLEKAPDETRETTPPKIPDVVTAPGPPPAPAPKPLPPLKLTPEQTLIAQIQEQVADVSNQYVNGLIQSVQANFRSSLLTVKVGDDWYTLEQAQQNKLATEMLKRSQQLNFVKLEMIDSKDNLLARSPVVGSEMVILKRLTGSPKTV